MCIYHKKRICFDNKLQLYLEICGSLCYKNSIKSKMVILEQTSPVPYPTYLFPTISSSSSDSVSVTLDGFSIAGSSSSSDGSSSDSDCSDGL